MYLNSFLYYLIFGSAILIYGAGLNRATVVSSEPKNILLNVVKMLITVTSSSVLTYLLVVYLLVPVELYELYPFIAALIFISISVFIESLVRLTAKKNTAEYGVSLICVLIAVNESISVLECLLISTTCICAFFIFIPILFSIRKRIEVSLPIKEFKNSSLLLISIAIIVIILFAWNISWLNPGVFK